MGMRKVVAVLGIVVVLIATYTLISEFQKSTGDEQFSLEVIAFANMQQILEQHPKMELVRQIEAEIQALSLWQKLLAGGLFDDIPSQRYEEGFREMLGGCESLERTIEALQLKLGATNGVETYIETRILEEARERIEKKRQELEETTIATIEAVEQQLEIEFSEKLMHLRDEYRILTFDIRLKLDFLNLSQEESSALANELHRIKRDYETKEENLKNEMTKALQSFSHFAYESMAQELKSFENAVLKQAREECEFARMYMQKISSLPESFREIDTDKILFVQNHTTLQVEVPELGEFRFSCLRDVVEAEFAKTVEWCNKEIERLLSEKRDLERAIMNEIKVVARSMIQGKNIHLQFVTGDEPIFEGVDLSSQVLEMINTRYDWRKGDS